MDSILGEIRPFAGRNSLPPDGWAFCNGALINIAGNEALYSLLGIQFGGNGTTNFALPDLRGRLPMGQGAAPGLTARFLAQTGGTEQASVVEAQIPSHSHAFTASKDAANASSPANALFANPSPNLFYANMPTPPVAIKTLLGDTIAGSGGSNQAHENRMPAMGMNYIIALQGIFPTKP
ncbi:MAG: tail fiber protein [Spirochaetota bacterium]